MDFLAAAAQRGPILGWQGRNEFIEGVNAPVRQLFIKSIVHPLTDAPGAQNVAAPKLSQMARNLGLGRVQCVHQMKHATLAMRPDHGDQPQAGVIGEAFAKSDRMHIRLCAYTIKHILRRSVRIDKIPPRRCALKGQCPPFSHQGPA